jgi:hypothetical protein
MGARCATAWRAEIGLRGIRPSCLSAAAPQTGPVWKAGFSVDRRTSLLSSGGVLFAQGLAEEMAKAEKKNDTGANGRSCWRATPGAPARTCVCVTTDSCIGRLCHERMVLPSDGTGAGACQ